MSVHTPAVKSFDTAYPGSMVERIDGYYVERNDHKSMAAALVELIASRDRELEDLRYSREADREETQRLLSWAYSKLVYRSFDSLDDALVMDEIKLILMGAPV